MKTSTILTRVRSYIRSDVDRYICHAIDRIESYGSADRDDCARVKKMIHTRMQMPAFDRWVDRHNDLHMSYDYYSLTETSLEWWLVWKGHVKIGNIPSTKKMREYRVAWLDSMIAEFEAKGD